MAFMAKPKYIFNHKTLTYELFQISTAKRIGRFVLVALAMLGVAALFAILLFTFFKSPKEKMQARELEYMKLQYEILNDRLDNMEVLLADMEERDNDIYRVTFEAEPIPSAVRRSRLIDIKRYDELQGYHASDQIINATRKLDAIESQLYTQSLSFDEVFEMARDKEEMLVCIPAIMPIKETDLKYISSYFGYRPDPIYKVSKFHSGLDLCGKLGTPIYATGDGKVVEVEKSSWGYGNLIVIDHGFGYETFYSHLKGFAVRRGQKVKRGQLIGYMGMTGKATGVHLHYEIRKNNKPVNPIHFFSNDLTPEQYEQILEQSNLPTQTMD